MTWLFQKNLLSTKEASEISGYHPDYLARLCRSGKIKGAQLGRTWLIDPDSLREFSSEQNLKKTERSSALSQLREAEYKKAQEALVRQESTTGGAVKNPTVSGSVKSPFVVVSQRAFALAVALAVVSLSAFVSQSSFFAQSGNRVFSILSEASSGFSTILAENIRVTNHLAQQYAPTTAVQTSIENTPRQEVPITLSLAPFAPLPGTSLLENPKAPTRGAPPNVMEKTHTAFHIETLVPSTGAIALSTGATLRDFIAHIPSETVSALAQFGGFFAQTSHAILATHERATYAYVTAAPEIPATTVYAVASFGDMTARAVVETGVRAQFAYNTAVTAFIASAPQIARSSAQMEVAFGTWLTNVSNNIVSAHVAVVRSGGQLISGGTSALALETNRFATPVSHLAAAVGIPSLDTLVLSNESGAENRLVAAPWSLFSAGREAVNVVLASLNDFFRKSGEVVASIASPRPFIVMPTIPSKGISGTVSVPSIGSSYVDRAVASVRAELNQRIAALSSPVFNYYDYRTGGGSTSHVTNIFNNSTTTVSGGGGIGTSTTDSFTAAYFIAASTTATSTFANGINVTGGCIALNGNCITTSVGAGITSLGAQYSGVQTGAGQTFATSSDTNLNLVITSSGNVHTFTPVWVGTLSVGRGGTGLSSVSNNGLLIGGPGNSITQVATSSLGLITTDIAEGTKLFFTNGRVQTYLDSIDKGFFFSTTSADYYLSVNSISSFSTTSADYWKTQRDFFSTTSAAYFLSQNQNAAFSTSSATYFLAQNQGVAFSTTSSNYWLTTKTTTDLAEGANLYYQDARVNLFIAGSSTIPKTYTNNVFTAGNTFTIATFTSATATNLFATNASTTNATSTNLFASLAHFANAILDAVTITTANITNAVIATLNATTATIASLTGYNATVGTLTATSSVSLSYTAANSMLATDATGKIVATTTPTGARFVATSSVASVFPYASTTGITASYASTSNLIVSNSFTLGTLSGILKATAGNVTAGLVSLATDITGILNVSNGGTGQSSFQANTVLIGNGTGGIATTTAGSNGQVLALVNGVPTWQATTTLANISGTLAVSSGGTGSTTLGGILTGNGTGQVTSATVSAPLSFSGNTLSISQATAGTNGYLSSADFSLFNNKISSSSLSGGTGISYNSSTGVITNTGITSIAQTFGTAQTGAITFATSSSATTGLTLGLNITNSSGAFTFAPTLSGTLNVANGGTGQSSFTTSQLLFGNGTNGLSSVATTSFTPSGEFTTTGTLGALVGGSNSTLALATNGVALTKLAQIAANSVLVNNTGSTGNVVAIATSTFFGTGTGGQVLTWNNGVPSWVATTTYAAGSGIATTFANGQLTITNTIGYPFPNNATSTLLSFLGGASTTAISANFAEIGGTGTTTFTSSGFVGVGTTSPWALLSVNPTVGNGSAPAFAIGSSTGTKFVVDNAGRVGVGVSPAAGYSINTSNGIQSASIIAASAFQTAAGPAFTFGADTDTGIFGGNNGNFVGISTAGSEISRFTTTGLGIGTSSPFTKLGVAGNAYIGGNLTATGTLAVSGNATLSGTATVGSTLTLSSIISCSGSQALQTNGSGDIACGTISVGGSSTGGGWTAAGGPVNGTVTLATTTYMVAVGATTTPYAKFSVLSGSAGTTTLALVPASGQTANILDIYNTSGALGSVFTAGGFLGIGTTSPSQALSVNGNGYINGSLTLGTALTVPNGGTGSTTLGGILTGNGTGQVTSAIVSSPLSFSGNILSISQANAGTNGYLSSSDWSLFNNKISSSSLSAVFPLAYNSTTGAFTYGGLSTSTAAVVGNIPYFSSANTFANVATTSHSFVGPFAITGTIGALIGGTNSTVTYTGLATTSQPNSSNLLVSNGGAGVYGVATTTLAVSGPLNVTGSLGSLIGGSNSTITYYGLATTSAIAQGQILYGTSASGVASVGTSTPTLSGAFSYSGTLGNFVGGSSGTLSLATNGVALSNLAQIAGNSILVNQTGVTGNVTAIATSTFGNTLYGTGTNGFILAEVNGVPTWVATSSINNGVSSIAQTFGTAQTGAITLASSTNGADFSITNSGGAFTFNLPSASATNRGLLTSADWTSFNNKISSTSLSGGTGISYTSATGVIANTGLLSLQQTGGGSAQTGAITLGTTTLVANGQTHGIAITNSAGAFTFAPTLSGTLNVQGGGTGITSVADGALVMGSSATALTSLATSTGGTILQTSFTTGRPTYVATSTLGIALADTTGTLSVSRGGTGSTTLGGLLSGNGTGAVTSATVSAPLAFSGNTLSITQANASTNGFLSNTDWSLFNNKISSTSLSATFPLAYNSTTGAFTYGGLSTSTAAVVGNIPYFSSANTFANVATTTETLGSEFSYSGTLGSLVGGSSGTLSLATNGVALTKLAQVAANTVLVNQTSATGNVTALATSTFAAGLYGFGTNGFILAEVNGVPTWVATSSINNGVSSIAQTFGTAQTGAITLASSTNGADFSITNSGGAFTFNLPSASATNRGLLTSADWTSFNNKISSTSLSGGTGISYTSATGVIANTGLLSLQQTGGGSAQTGAITFATSSQTTNGQTIGLNITNSAGAFTFAPTISGTLTVAGGGTGSTTLGGLLSGNGTGAVTSATVSAPLAFSGNTLSITQANASTNGFLSNTDWSLFNNKISSTSLSATFPLAYNSTTGAFTYGGLSTSTAAVVGNIPYFSGANTFANVATTTETLGSEFSYSGTLGSLVGGSSGTLTLATNGVALTKLAQVAANTVLVNQTSATGNVTALATSTFAAGLYGFGTNGFILAEVNGVPTWVATTTLSTISGTLSVAKGGTGQTSFGQGWLGIDNSGAFISSTSPTVNYFTATSTTATSTINGALQVGTSGTLTVIPGSGRVGINVLSPGTDFDVSGNTRLSGGLGVGVLNTTSGTISTVSSITAGTQFLNASSNAGAPGYSFPGDLTTGIFHPASNAIGFAVGGNEWVRINSSGFLSVGSTSPTANLSVQGLDGGTSPLFIVASSSATSVKGTALMVDSQGNALLGLNGSRVGVGTTSPGSVFAINSVANFSAATTSFSSTGGINLSAGCFAINGTCLSQNAGTITAIGPTGQQVTSGAVLLATSTTGTDFTITGSGNTLTFNLPSASATNRGLLTSSDWSLFNNKISSTSLSGGTGISYTSATGVIANTGLLSLQQTGGGSAQTGAITFATSSQTTNGQTIGLNITNSAGAFTFAPTLSGTLNVQGGGTGITSVADGALVMGSSATALTSLATSTGGTILQTSFTTGRPTYVATSTLGIALADTTGTLSVSRGGTGSTTLGGLLSGNGTSAVTAATVSAPLSFSGNTLSISQANASTNGFLSNTDWSLFNNKISSTSLSATFPLAYNSTTGAFTYGGLSTSTAAVVGNIPYFSGANTFANVATTTETLGSEFSYSGTLGSLVGGSSGTLTLATNGVALTKLAQVAANTVLVNQTSATGNVTALATSTFAAGLYGFGTNGFILAEVNGVPTWVATSSINNGVSSIAQTFGTAQTGAITLASSTNGADFSITNSGGAFTFNLPSASATNRGLLTSSDWSLFNNKISSTSLSGGTGISYTSATGVIANTGVTSLAGTANQITASAATGAVTLSIPTQFNIQNASTTNFSANTLAVGGTGTTSISSTGALTIQSLSGLLKATNGLVSTAVAGTDYANFAYPFIGNATTTLLSFNGGASTTAISANTAAFGGTATTTFLANGFAGHGTSSPWAQLSINPTAVNGSAPSFVIGSSSATSFVVTNAGNVGIGTTTPSRPLYVSASSAQLGLDLTNSASNSQVGFFENSTLKAAINHIGSTFATTNRQNNIEVTSVSGAVAFWTNGNERLRVDNNGTIGIGTTTPYSGQLTIASTTGPQLSLTDGSLGNAPYTFRSINGVLYIATSSPATFATSTLSALTILANGNVGFATSTPGSALAIGSTNGINLSTTATSTFGSTGGGINIASGCFAVNGVCLSTSGGGVTSIQQTGGGSAQTGAITFATSSQTTNGQTVGLNITNSAGAFTFAPTLSGTLNVQGGGTGITSVADGALVMGSSATALTSLATSTGGTILQTSFTTGRPTYVATSTLGIALADTTGTLALNRGGTATTTFYNGGVIFSDSTKLTQASNTGNNIFFWDNTNARLGLGTSTPWAQFSVNPNVIGSGPVLAIGSSTGTLFDILANGNVGIGTTSPYAKLVVQGEAVALNFTATSTTATSTFAGGLNVGNGALTYDFSGGITSINNLALGSMTFDTDAGVLSWIDMPVTSNAATGTVESYSAQIDGNPILTVYSTSDGMGSIYNPSVGIGSSTPWATFSVEQTATNTPVFVVGDQGTTTPHLLVSGRGFTGFGTTTPWAHVSINPLATDNAAPAFVVGSSSATNLIVTNAGLVGIGSTTPGSILSIGATNGINLSITATSTFGSTGGGINIKSGCFAINGVCVGGGSGTNYFTNSGASTYLSTGSNLGVGSTTPWGKVSINQDVSDGNIPSFVIGSSTATNFIVTNTGNVGIGTTTPYAPSGSGLTVGRASGASSVTVDGSSSGTGGGGVFNIYNAGTVYGYFGNNSAIAGGAYDNQMTLSGFFGLKFNTNGATQVAIDTGGKVGVGSTTPWAHLSVNPVAADGTAPAFAIGSSTATNFVVTNAGLVGIGSSTPSAPLSVDSNFTYAGVGGVQAVFAARNTSGPELYFTGNTAYDGRSWTIGANGSANSGTGGAGTFAITDRTVNTARLVIDTVGNTGIGSTTPWGVLSVNPIAGSGSAPAFVIGSSTATRFMVTNAGKVGIATTSPFGMFSVESSLTNDIAVFKTADPALHLISSTVGKDYILQTVSSDSRFRIFDNSVGAERLTLTSAGNVAIGTSTATANLQIGSSFGANPVASPVTVDLGGTYGSSAAGSSANLKLKLYDDGLGNNYGLGVSSGLFENQVATGGKFAWFVAGSEMMRLDSTGNLGIGTTSPWADVSINPLATNGTAPAFVIGSSTATNLIVTNAGLVGISSSTPGSILSIGSTNGINLSITATSTFGSTGGGINIKSGCFAVNGVCISSGGGSITGSGVANQVTYWSGTNSITGNAAFTFDGTTLTLPALATYGSNAATTTIKNNTPYAWTLATSTTGLPLISIDTTTNAETVNIGIPGGTVYIGSVSAPSNLIAEPGAGLVGFGTTSPKWLLTLASTSGPQLTLTDGSLANAPFNFRSINGNLFISTSSAATFATSTLSALSILSNGFVGIASSTPGSAFAIGALNGINFSTTGTSTFNGTGGGINIASGCFSINGVCAGTGGVSAGTVGQIPYYAAAGTSLTATSSLFIDTDSDIGIGTTTPWGNLAINPTAADGTAPAFVVGSSSATSLIVTNSGKVGIGTTTPPEILSVQAASPQLSFYGTTAGRQATVGLKDGFNLSIFNPSGNVFLQETSGSVGVGTTTPWAQLSVNPTAAFGTAPSFVVGSSSATRLVVNNAGNVGIGTAAPSSLLTLSVAAVSSQPTLEFNGGTTNFTGTTFGSGKIYGTFDGSAFGTDRITFATHSAAGTYVDTLTAKNGQVGIGTTSPAFTLNIASSTGPQLALSDGSLTSAAVNFRSINGNLFISTSSAATFATTSVAALTINTNGYVGIGNTAPTLNLQLGTNVSTSVAAPVAIGLGGTFGNNTAGSSGNLKIQLYNDNSGNIYGFGMSGGTLEYQTPSNGAHVFFVGGSEKLRLSTTGFFGAATGTPWGQVSINPTATNGTAPAFVIGSSSATSLIVTNSGNVGIGTVNPTSKLSVINAAASAAMQITSSYSSGSGDIAYFANGASGGSTLAIGAGATGATLPAGVVGLANAAFGYQLYLNSSGNVGIGSTTPWAQFSVNPVAVNGTAPSFVIGSSSATNFIVTNAGLVGLGTSTPGSILSIAGVANFTTATSTFYTSGGINLASGGCFAQNGVCISGGTPFSNTLLGGGTGTTTFYNGGVVYSDGNKLTQSGSPQNFFWNETNKALGIGTSSPYFQLMVASSTGPQLALSDGSLGNNPWTFRSINGNLYIGTSSPATFATSSIPTIAFMNGGVSGLVGIGSSTPWGKFSIEMGPTHPAFVVANFGSSSPALVVSGVNQNGRVGIGTSSPFATLAIQTNMASNEIEPALFIATTSAGGFGQEPLLTVLATTTGKLNYARVGIGTTSPWGTAGLRDQLTVDGRVYTTWRYAACDIVGAGMAGVITADTTGVGTNICGQFSFDVQGTLTSALVSGYPPYYDLRTATTPIANSGTTMRMWNFVTAATTSPIVEAWVRVGSSATVAATTTPFYLVGLYGTAASNANQGTLPADGIFFVATSTNTWYAVTGKNSVYTMVNTFIGTSTTQFQKLRVEATDQQATFLINGTVVATIATNIPVKLMAPAVVAAIATGATSGSPNAWRDLNLSLLRFWMDDPPGGVPGGAAGTEAPFDSIQGADIAEAYLSDNPAKYVPGLIIANASSTPNGIRLAQGAYDNGIMGAITTSPHEVLGQESTTTVRVGLVGRVPVIVSLANGPIKQGDSITTGSTTQGIGVKALRPGRIVGQALEDMTAAKCDTNLVDELAAVGVTAPSGACLARIMVKLDPSFDMSIGNLIQDATGIVADVMGALDELNNAAFNQGAQLTKYVVGELVAKIAVVDKFFANIITILPGGEVNAPAGDNQVAGLSTLATGTKQTFINNTKVTASSKIFITPRALTASALAVTEIQPGVGFRVETLNAPASDVPFDWFFVNAYGGQNAPNVTVPQTPPANAPTNTGTTTPPSGNTGNTGGGTTGGGTGTSTPPGDTTPPTVTLNGNAALQLIVGDAFTDPGATAQDDVSGDVSGSITVSGSVDTATPGTYTLTYSAHDAAGNQGSASRVVTVVVAPATP